MRELGIVSFWHRNPLIRLAWGMRKFLGTKAIALPALLAAAAPLGDASTVISLLSLAGALFMLGAVLQVNGGRAIVTNRLKGAGTEPLNYGWGTGAGTTAAGDTTLFTEVLVNMTAGGTDHTAGTSTQQTTSTTNDTYRVVATRTATAVGTITNAGQFDAASGGNLFLKGDFTGIGQGNGDAIQFTGNVQYA